jgi:hypothetical protein
VGLLTIASTLNDGDVAFDPSVPVEDARATIDVSAVGYGRTLRVAGRSAQIGVLLPYSFGNLEGLYLGQFQKVRRSGLVDPTLRFGINLFGAPAMTLKQFAAYRTRTNVGASLTVQAPLGQYDSAKLINLGNNRWAFKPELGLTHARGRWTFEAYVGVGLFTDNTDFLHGGRREQAPILSSQLHVLYTLRPRLWVGVDTNFWTGGRVTVNGTENQVQLKNSRVGVTFVTPVGRHQSLRLAYSRGAYTTIGGDFNSFGASYSYSWVPKP